jgi:hypothetical protein
MVCVTYENTDGTISVVYGTPELYARLGDDSEVANHLLHTAVPPHARPSAYVMDPRDVPQDRTFRDAWRKPPQGGPVGVDMDEARKIHMQTIREKRDEMLTELDIESLRAVEDGDGQKAFDVAAKKKALRDLPDNIDLSSLTTPEELKNFLPAELAP